MSQNPDKGTKNELLNKLIDFGLTAKEASVYMALLPRPDVGSSKLSQVTGLHRQFVYDALKRLEELGLARHVIQNGRKKFNANTPNRLLALVEEKRLTVQSVAKELQDLFAGKHEQNFEVYQGDTAFVAHQLELLQESPEGSFLHVISGANERFSATHKAMGVWDEYESIRKEKKIRVRFLGAETQREWLEWRHKNEHDFDYRILPNVTKGKISIDIRVGSVNFLVYGEVVVDFTLTSKDLAEGYQEFFDSMWSLATK